MMLPTNLRRYRTSHATKEIANYNKEAKNLPETKRSLTAQTSLIPETDDAHLARIRALLRPPPIPGLSEWGIPPEVESNCDPELEAKLNQFHQLKSSSTPKHFNDTLMSNRSFRNPHLYAQLVEFVDIDERTTNFPKEIWNLEGLKDGEWDAEKIAKYQKIRSEQQSQQSKARTHIDFATGKDNVRCLVIMQTPALTLLCRNHIRTCMRRLLQARLAEGEGKLEDPVALQDGDKDCIFHCVFHLVISSTP
ncbi:HCNGP-like protein-domain-containing protein [Lentinula boryana]|uniref:HCNGP-like protein-domain-containing protein n=1 Tax=Lentinula boryana TaxID=40481 RepID=A0ABQ8Q7Y0_9AGAR|nr:HCNGP-like protein-domain-containing protein [Lentinula boryana]